MSMNIGFFKINEYIITIKIHDDIKLYNDLVNVNDHYYATYITNNFTIIKIEHMFTKKPFDKIKNISINNDILTFNTYYEINKTYTGDKKIYYLSYDKAFFKDFIDKAQFNLLNKEDNNKYYNVNTRYTEWYDNGQLKLDYWHINGKKEGLYKEYDIDGKLITKKNYFSIDDKIDNKIENTYSLFTGDLSSVPLI